jgi:hypothetical protein
MIVQVVRLKAEGASNDFLFLLTHPTTLYEMRQILFLGF